MMILGGGAVSVAGAYPMGDSSKSLLTGFGGALLLAGFAAVVTVTLIGIARTWFAGIRK